MKNRRAQLSIFLLVSLMIIILLIAIFFFNSSDDKLKLENSKLRAKSTNSNIDPIKEHIDFCLEKQLRRSLIIAGLRGGFIYDDGEYYSSSSIPKDTYDNGFIANMNLNWNNLLFSTLVHSQADVYTPKIDSPLSIDFQGVKRDIYTKSIKEDFERFILEEFISCVDFESFEPQGYNVIYENYLAKILSINSNSNEVEIKASPLSGKVGDEVELRVLDKILLGKIKKLEKDSSLISFSIGDFENIPIEEELSNLNILNKNLNISVEVNFGNEDVSAKLNFPATLKGNDFEVSHKTSVTKTSVRFLDLLRLSSLLSKQKYLNKSIDLLNEEDINQILSRNPLPGKSDLSNIRIQKTKINSSEKYIKNVFSLIDDKSLILGNSYVFNFGYENNAPEIDLNKLNANLLEAEGALFVVSKNHPIKVDLKKLTSDKQAIDNFRSYYVEDSYFGSDASFEIKQNGELSFEAFIDSKFTFPITVTDSEAINTQNFIFLSGFPDNSNNRLAKECLSFVNQEAPGVFPINEDFKDKIFSFNNSGFEELYSYALFLGDNLNKAYSLRQSELYFKESCLVSYDFFDLEIEVKEIETNKLFKLSVDKSNGKILLPLSRSALEVNITIIEKATKSPVTEDFKITIYPASCLGPKELSPTESALLGGDLSCCNLQPVYQSVFTKTPKNFFKNYITEDSGVILDATSYFCFDFTQIATNPFLGSYSSKHTIENIWENDQDKTSLYEGNVRAICNGNTAIGIFESVSPTQGADFVANSKQIGYSNLNLEQSVPISLTKVQSSSPCEFCFIKETTPFRVHINDDLVFFTGLKLQNLEPNSVGISPLPFTFNNKNLGNTFIMCDNNWYGSTEGTYDETKWDKLITGEGGPSRIYKSKGYCYQGTNTCSGRPNNIPGNFASRVDNQPNECIDWSLKPNGEFINNPNTGWSCGINGTCQSGTCIEFNISNINISSNSTS